jgi:DNA-binding LacI/PurR family transcriptional regulator
MSKPPGKRAGRKREHAATAMQVARLAGVSQSAVSRAFTPGASVADATRAKIAKAAQSLGYRPNLLARSLITRQSRIIGVAVAYMGNQFYPQLLQALSALLHAAGYRILLFTPEPSAEGDPVLEEVLRYRVDALILASTSLSSHLAEECARAGVPVVLVNRKSAFANVSSVTGDNRRGGARIAEFLLAGGHQRLCFLAGLEDSSTSRDREAGFVRRLKQFGAPAPERAIGHYSWAEAAAAVRSLLSRKQRPDAIFCANDHMAFAAIETARAEFGLRMGKDISIIGFDDVGLAAWPSFSLTTFSQPIEAMAQRVVEMVTALLRGPGSAPVQEIVPGELVVRGSARAPKAGLHRLGEVIVWRPGTARLPD